MRDLARWVYEHPDGSQRQYTRGSLDRWIRAYREQGLSGLKPEPRSDLGPVRRHPELLDEACALRAELPTRSAAQIAAILFARHRIRVAQRTINQHLRQRGLHRAALSASRVRSAGSRRRGPTSCGSATCWSVRSSHIRAPVPAVARTCSCFWTITQG